MLSLIHISSERGGGLFVSGHTNGPVSVLDNVISGCEAKRGGGVALIGFAELEPVSYTHLVTGPAGGFLFSLT